MTRTRSSKKNRSLIIGLICGLGCALCVGLYIADVDERAHAAQAEMLAKYGGDQIEVCVARRDIAPGESIAESDIETRTWIASLLPADAISTRSDAVGKQVGSTILSGEVISAKRFGAEAAEVDVPDGYSAISVPTQEVQAVGGALKAGMRTDVYAVGSSATAKLGSKLLVLATNNSDDATSSSTLTWVTLAVAPDRVEEMVSAAQNLDIYFVLPGQAAPIGSESKGADGSSTTSEASRPSDASSVMETAEEAAPVSAEEA